MADEGTVAGQGPLLGWNKAQDAISKLAKNVEALNKGLETAAAKMKTVGGGAQGLWQGWHSGGSGSQSGARGFGMLANDVWNNTSNYGHGRPNGGASAPSTAPRAGGQQRQTTSANGGGAAFSGQTGQGGGAANNGGQGGSGGSGTNTPRLGGGAGNNGGQRKSPYTLKGGLKDFYAWSTKQMPDKVLMDSVTYQSGQISSQSYAATARQAFTNNYGAQSTPDAGAAYQTLAQSTAGSPGSANFNSAWNYAKTSGYLNPGVSEAQRVRAMTGAWTAQSYYANQAIGIQTIKNGKRQDPRQIAQQVMQRWSSLKNVKNKDQIHDTLSDGSAMMQSLARTMPADTLQQVKSELTGMLNAQIKGASEQQYVSTMNKANSGDKSAKAQLKKWNIGDSDAQSIQDRAATLRNQDVNTLQPFNDGLKTATTYLDKFSTAVQSFLKSTHLDTPIGWAGGAGSMVGSAVGSAVGNYGMMRGLGMAGRMLGGTGGAGSLLGGAGTAAADGGMMAGAGALLRSPLAKAGGLGLAGWGIHAAGDYAAKHVKNKKGKKAINVASATLGDAAYGAAIGTLFGPEGTVIGGAIGGGYGLVSSLWGGDGGSGSSAASATGGKGKSGAVATGTNGAGKTAAAVIKVAMKYLGVKYVWGGSSPKGFDCSGLIQFSFKQIGVSLPRTAAQQQKAGKPVKLGQERAGDLLFNGNPAHHVVMCIGNGKIIEAPHTGSSVRIRAYQPGEFTNAVRILGAVGNLGDLTDDGTDTAGSDSNRLSSMGFGGDVGSYGSVEEVDAIAAGIASVGAANVGSGVGAGQGGSSSKSTDNGSVPGSMPTGNLKGWIKSALGILHQDTASNEKYVNTMALHESGGNPHAQNNWDSNAKAGHPSKGIMQTIDSTFNAYSLAGHKNIWNPVDNIIAGVRYADSRYGSLAKVPGIKSMANGGSYKGYAVGSANIDVDQTARVHKGEMIIPAHQADAIRKALSSNTPLAGGIGGLNTSGGKATLNFHAGAITVQVSGAMDQTSARDAANKFMTALAEDNRINLIAAGN
jgi:SLT domain-containing protein/cell wall-associated NlpC family hydrolase